MNIAINGFGRIGRTFLRVILERQKTDQPLRVVAINCGPGASIALVAHLFKYDTLMGRLQQECYQEGDYLFVGEQKIKLFTQADPLECCWKELGIEWVVDCSGKFTKAEKARVHMNAGAQRVLISAPADDCDITIIPGINDDAYLRDKHHIVSLGSCTTNAFLPLLKVMDASFGIKQAYMTTVHAYTNSQVLLDVERKDPRISRSASLNIIPASTGASRVVGVVMPELNGKVHAMALRVPVAKGSLIDLTVHVNTHVDTQALMNAFNTAADSYLQAILGVTYDPIVSSDSNGCSYSVLVDGLLLSAQGGLAKVFGWYDNEWGYSYRLYDFLKQRC